MTKIERIQATLRFGGVDRLPKGEFHLEDGFVAQLLGLKEKVEFRILVGWFLVDNPLGLF